MSSLSSVPKEPLSRAFNVCVKHIASRLFPTGFDVSDRAPGNLETLKAHVASTGRMVVYSGQSDGTIFECPETNYAMRAWHDWCHLQGDFPFTLVGEIGACTMQQSHVRLLYGIGAQADYFCQLIEAEVVGQSLYYERFGTFVTDQRAFVEAWLHNPALLRQMLTGKPFYVTAPVTRPGHEAVA